MTATVASLFLVVGAIFLLVSCVGLLRLPDFYTRAHAVGKAETLGSILILAGLALYNGASLSSLKLLFILVVIAITNPTATHALTRAALRSGLKIWRAEGKRTHRDLAG
ncbi:MAG: monovalent cation/H(+) antiporter subunit G [Deltaproteobacteria bacterium]|nr:monovalent cation/H(+) antiporter subunit G [Deltaproteobacteria bacterium]